MSQKMSLEESTTSVPELKPTRFAKKKSRGMLSALEAGESTRDLNKVTKKTPNTYKDWPSSPRMRPSLATLQRESEVDWSVLTPTPKAVRSMSVLSQNPMYDEVERKVSIIPSPIIGKSEVNGRQKALMRSIQGSVRTDSLPGSSKRGHGLLRNTKQAATKTKLAVERGWRDTGFGRLEFCAIFCLLVSAALLLGLSLEFFDFLEIPDNAPTLELDVPVFDVEIKRGESQFYRVQVDADELYVFIMFRTAAIDPFLRLIKEPDEILSVNDDLDAENLDAVIVYFSEKTESLVLEASNSPASIRGTYGLIAQKISEVLQVDQPIVVAFFPFFVSYYLVELEAGVSYFIYAFNEVFDTAVGIRVRSQSGEELIEAFQSTAIVFSARALFTPQKTETYVLEIRSISDVFSNLTVLVATADVTQFSDDAFAVAGSTHEDVLLSTTSTLVAFSLREDVEYEFEIDLDIPDLSVANVEYFPFEIYNTKTDNSVGRTIGEWEGVSIRFYNQDENQIVLRTRTDFQLQEAGSVSNGLLFVLFNVSAGDTRFTFTPDKDVKLIMEISRMIPDYLINETLQLFNDDKIGNFTLNLVKENRLSEAEIKRNDLLADQSNLFVDCQVDPIKYTIEDGCEAGIAVFCRNEFFSSLDSIDATKEEFSNICSCVDFLCTSLPSGERVGAASRIFQELFYGGLAVISISAMLVYFYSIIDLCSTGDLLEWSSGGLVTFTMSAFFFLCATIFYITQIYLTQQLDVFKFVSEEFDFKRVPIPNDRITTFYYDTVITEILYGELPDSFTDRDFLNDLVSERLSQSLSFKELEVLVLINLISFVFYRSLTVVCFFDVVLVWIDSARLVAGTRQGRKNRLARWRRILRVLELGIFIALLVFTVVLVRSNGRSYSYVPSAIIVVLSVVIVIAFSYGRCRLRSIMMITLHSSDDKRERRIREYLKIIQRTSTIAIVSSIGIIITQVFSVVTVQEFEDLVRANNDYVAFGISLFQDCCFIVGQLAIFHYLFKSYRSFKASIFEPIKAEEEEDEEDDRGGESKGMSTVANTDAYTNSPQMSDAQRSSLIRMTPRTKRVVPRAIHRFYMEDSQTSSVNISEVI